MGIIISVINSKGNDFYFTAKEEAAKKKSWRTKHRTVGIRRVIPSEELRQEILLLFDFGCRGNNLIQQQNAFIIIVVLIRCYTLKKEDQNERIWIIKELFSRWKLLIKVHSIRNLIKNIWRKWLLEYFIFPMRVIFRKIFLIYFNIKNIFLLNYLLVKNIWK